MASCSYNIDPLKLVRDGTSQELRVSPALSPAYAPVDERIPAHGMVFGQAYSEYLNYFDENNNLAGKWTPFFSEDVSVQLAVAGVQNVEHYRRQVREYADFLNDRQNSSDVAGLRDRLDFLFSCCATLSIRLDQLIERLPAEIALKRSLQNLVRSQLAPHLQRLIAYHKGGDSIVDAERPLNDSAHEVAAPLTILGGNAVKFSELAASNLSQKWSGSPDWATYFNNIPLDTTVYGNLIGTSVFERVNHIATRNLFKSVLDQFLRVYARTVSDAKAQLKAQFEDPAKAWDRHQPHYALFLAFLHLMGHPRTEANTLTGRHLDFFYR
jgi:hypothetical protein